MQYRFEEICQSWGLKFKGICDEIEISGSLDRSEFRCVIETGSNEKFLLELLPEKSLDRKRHIFQILDKLGKNGVSKLIPYLRNQAGQVFTFIDGDNWQISRYIPGSELIRPDYIQEAWRGHELAKFYRLFRNKGNLQSTSTPFSLKLFCEDFLDRVSRNNPELLPKIQPAFDYLSQDFFKVEHTLPMAFCHGDLHPINVIWGDTQVKAVIDWEFSGDKLEIYDLANLIGCLGFERPVGLNSEFALAFIKKTRSLFKSQSMIYLFETILAQRLTWLSDWLRRKDEEMINLEIAYINLLLKYRKELKECWGIK